MSVHPSLFEAGWLQLCYNRLGNGLKHAKINHLSYKYVHRRLQCRMQLRGFLFQTKPDDPFSPSPEQQRGVYAGAASSPGGDGVSQEAGGCRGWSCGLPKASLPGAFPPHVQFLQAFGAGTAAPHPRWLSAQKHTTPCPSSVQQHLLGIFNRFAHQ